MGRIVYGMGDGRFAPNDNITREQLVTILYNYAVSKGFNVSRSDSLSRFSDAASVSSWAQTSMQWAVANKIVSGIGKDKLAAADSATRAQVAKVIAYFRESFVR